MKRLNYIFLLIFFVFGFSNNVEYETIMNEDHTGPITYYQTNDPVYIPKNYVEREVEMRGVWMSAVTADVVKYTNESTFKSNFRKAINVLKANKLNTLFYQVRPTNDAFYRSELNPLSKYFIGSYSDLQKDLVDPGFDTFAWVIDECHANGIEIHAWLNPYRVTTTAPANQTVSEYLETLKDNNFAKMHPEYLVTDTTGKILLNPGIPEVVEFIDATVFEIIDNYDVDGIHFDDYFYSYEGYKAGFDNEQYIKYKVSNQTIDDWRRSNVDNLIYTIQKTVRSFNLENDKTIAFGVSPFGIWDNLQDNPNGSNTKGTSSYRTCYADTRKWVKEEWVDYIVPQIYWHFEHEVARYADLVDWWVDVCRDTNVNLYIGHGMYKYDRAPIEWKNSPNELALQIKYNTKYDTVKGSVLFSYYYIRDKETSANLFRIKDVFEIINTMWTHDALVPQIEIKLQDYLDPIDKIIIIGEIRKNNVIQIRFQHPKTNIDEKIEYVLYVKEDEEEYYEIIEYTENDYISFTLKINNIDNITFKVLAKSFNFSSLSKEYSYQVELANEFVSKPEIIIFNKDSIIILYDPKVINYYLMYLEKGILKEILITEYEIKNNTVILKININESYIAQVKVSDNKVYNLSDYFHLIW